MLNTDVAAGKYVEAGLPNATGRAYNTYSQGLQREGALYMASDTSGGETSGVNEINNALSRRREIFLNLSKSNSIYGNSDTVQPPTLTIRYIVKY